MLAFLSLLSLLPVLAYSHNISRSALANLQNRGGSAKFTNYNAGQGACGATNSDSDFVVALTAQQFDNGAHCFKEIYIEYNGISATAKIVDECMNCPYNGLDFSQSLFGHFVGGEQNNLNVGVIYGASPSSLSIFPGLTSMYAIGDWSYGSGPSDDTTTTKKTTTTTQAATTTKATTTSTHATTTTTSSHTSSSAAASATSASFASSSPGSATAAAPTSTDAVAVQNLHDFTQALLNLAGLIVQAPKAA